MKFAEILEHAQLAAHWEEIPGGVIPGTTRISPNRSRKKEQNPSLENPNRPPGQRTCHGLSPASHGEVGRLQPTTMKRWWCLIGEHAKGFPIAGTIYQGGVSFQEYKSHSVCCAVLLFSTVARGSSSFEHEFKYLLKFGKLGWVRGFSVGVEL